LVFQPDSRRVKNGGFLVLLHYHLGLWITNRLPNILLASLSALLRGLREHRVVLADVDYLVVEALLGGRYQLATRLRRVEVLHGGSLRL